MGLEEKTREPYPIEVKSTEELIKECNEALRNHKPSSTLEEAIIAEIEDDAEGGYRPDDEN